MEISNKVLRRFKHKLNEISSIDLKNATAKEIVRVNDDINAIVYYFLIFPNIIGELSLSELKLFSQIRKSDLFINTVERYKLDSSIEESQDNKSYK